MLTKAQIAGVLNRFERRYRLAMERALTRRKLQEAHEAHAAALAQQRAAHDDQVQALQRAKRDVDEQLARERQELALKRAELEQAQAEVRNFKADGDTPTSSVKRLENDPRDVAPTAMHTSVTVRSVLRSRAMARSMRRVMSQACGVSPNAALNELAIKSCWLTNPCQKQAGRGARESAK